MSRSARRVASLVALVSWSALMFRASSDRAPDALLALEIPDFVLHLAEYAVFGALGAWWIGAETGLEGRGLAIAVGILALSWGLADEWHQSFVPGRDPSAADLAADLAGGLLGAAAFAALGPRRSAARERPATGAARGPSPPRPAPRRPGPPPPPSRRRGGPGRPGA